MSVKIQVNIRLTSGEHARLLEWAAEAGLERGALARDIVVEGIDAKSEGRATFSRETLGPGDLVALAAKLDKSVMEVERFANTWAAHETELLSLERQDRLAMHSARTEFLAGFPERISRSLEPIKAEMTVMKAAIADQPRLDAIDKKQAELVEAVRGNTEAIKEVRKAPRKVTGLVLSDDRFWSSAFVCLWSLLMVGAGIVFITGLGMSVPAIGIPLSHKLAAGDAEFCRLIRYRFETETCQVPVGHRIDPAGALTTASGKPSRTKAGAASAKAKRS
jgi:hypothetical protein